MGKTRSIGWSVLAGVAGWAILATTRRFSEAKRNAVAARGKTIAIIGAGFGGRAVALELARLLPDPASASIVLIDEDNYLLFTPMLTEAAGGELETHHIAVPLGQLPSRISFVQGAVSKIDLSSRTVTVKVNDSGPDRTDTQITADHLVIALGSVTNYHHIPGVAEHSLGVKQLGDASAICKHVLSCLERAKTEKDEARSKALLTFVVAGGGYTGVETMAAINDLVRDQVADRARATDRVGRTILIDPGDRLLSETSPKLATYAARKLQERGVEIRMKTSITGASADSVEVKPGGQIPTHTLIWAAGVKPNPIVSDLDCEKGKHGGVKVNGSCQMEGHAGVWAIGDCAEIPTPSGKPASYAPTAQNATREGVLVARNIVGALRGLQPRPFTYKPLGELALVGKRAGVARLLGFNISGVLAWALWRAVYLAKMPGTAQKIRVVGDWTLDFVFGRSPVLMQTKAIASNTLARPALEAHGAVAR